jgi:hypothetical protein
MKEVLVVILSALVGYIVLSAFSVSNTPQEALRRIGQQSVSEQEIEKRHERELAEIQSKEEIEKAKINAEVQIQKDEHSTKIEIEGIKAQTDSTIANIKHNTAVELKEKDNTMLVVMAMLVFILIYVYLRYQRSLAQVEIEKDREYKQLLAKKEYAERILAIVATGNISIETEHKLLKILDELNSPSLPHGGKNESIMHHPNPDIEQLPLQSNF